MKTRSRELVFDRSDGSAHRDVATLYVKKLVRYESLSDGSVVPHFRLELCSSLYPTPPSKSCVDDYFSSDDDDKVEKDIAEYNATHGGYLLDDYEYDCTLFLVSAYKKLPRSVRRAKRTVRDLAMCNDFKLFVTFTFDPERMRLFYPFLDLHNRDELYKILHKWLNNYCSSHHCKLMYVIVPEPHERRTWHFHALMSGIPDSDLEFRYHFDKGGRREFHWISAELKFGWTTATYIEDYEHCSWYVTKYMSETFEFTSIGFGKKMYYCSKGLRRPDTLFYGYALEDFLSEDYLNSWTSKDGMITKGYLDFDNEDDFDSAIEYFRDNTLVLSD